MVGDVDNYYIRELEEEYWFNKIMSLELPLK